MLGQVAMTKLRPDQLTRTTIKRHTEMERYRAIILDIEAARRAARNSAMSNHYRAARETDVLYYGAEIVCLEQYTPTPKLRRLCAVAIEKYNFDRSFPIDEESDEYLLSDMWAPTREAKAKFESSYLRDAERNLVAAKRRLANCELSSEGWQAAETARKLHEFELVWLFYAINDDARRLKCSQIIDKHGIDRQTAHLHHTI